MNCLFDLRTVSNEVKCSFTITLSAVLIHFYTFNYICIFIKLLIHVHTNHNDLRLTVLYFCNNCCLIYTSNYPLECKSQNFSL